MSIKWSKLGSSSVLALLAMAFAAADSSKSFAADLGGNCCADLEERVAELEATTARKGNRKVSLQVYGQVSEAIIWWNDGSESNAYVQENQDIKNKLGFIGAAKINGDWSAGFKLEMQIRAYRSSGANQLALGSTNGQQIPAYNTQSISLREANWYIDSKTYGRITVGRVPDAAYNVDNINLAAPDGFASYGYAMGRAHQGYFLRRAGTTGNTGLSNANWNTAFFRNNSLTADYDYGVDHSGVKYTSPYFLGQSKSTGFQVQSSWGMDDTWSSALRYVEDFAGFRIAAGVGYTDFRGAEGDNNQCTNLAGAVGTATSSAVSCNSLIGSASLMHLATGLYVSGGAGKLVDNNRKAGANLTTAGLGSRIDDTDTSWWIQGGWVAKLAPIGATTFWGSYADYTSHGNVANNVMGTLGGTDVLNSFASTVTPGIQTAQASTMGLGITQDIDAAAMKLFIGYLKSSADLTLINRTTFATQKSNAIDDISVVYTGATIRF